MNSKSVKLNSDFNKHITPKYKKRRSRVTVCIAAIFGNNAIIGLSDRMITTEDIEFQPPQSKILRISNAIAFMTAGDSNIQTQLYSKTAKVVGEKIEANPKKWVTIEETANIYKDFFFDFKNRLAKDMILSPYMLDQETFVERQRMMSREFIDRIAYNLETFRTEPIGAIIAGIDETGPHIYTIRNGEISCDDGIGFTSIGIGSNHALSHLMLSGYTRDTILPKAFLTIHQAKKKAEVSPGVGEKTDMFLVGPQLGSLFVSNPKYEPETLKQLDRFYMGYTKGIENLNKRYLGKMEEHLKTLIEKQKSVSSVSPSVSPSPEAESEEDKIVENDNGEKKE